MNVRTDILHNAAAGLLGEPPADCVHVDVETMASYLEGTLSGEDSSRVREHLLGCAECNHLLLDYEQLSSGELGADLDASEAEVAAVWRGIAREIGKEGPPATAGVSLSVVDAEGEVVWRGEGLRRNAYGSVSLSLPRDLLPPGEYRLRLEATTAGKTGAVHEFVLRIEHAKSG